MPGRKAAPTGCDPVEAARSQIPPQRESRSMIQPIDPIARIKSGDKLLTPGEVALFMRVDPKAVTRWAKAGKLVAVETLGGHRRYWESDVRAVLMNRLQRRPVEHVAAGMTVMYCGEPVTVIGVCGEYPRTVRLDLVDGYICAQIGESVAIVIGKHGQPVTAPPLTAEQALTRGVRLPVPQHVSGLAMPWLTAITTLPRLHWSLLESGDLSGQAHVAHRAYAARRTAVEKWAAFLGTPTHLMRPQSIHLETAGYYLGAYVRVWAQIRDLEPSMKAVAA